MQMQFTAYSMSINPMQKNLTILQFVLFRLTDYKTDLNFNVKLIIDWHHGKEYICLDFEQGFQPNHHVTLALSKNS